MSDLTLIRLGAAQRPATGDDLRRLLLMGIAADNRASGISMVGEPAIEAEMDGEDVARLSVDMPTVHAAMDAVSADPPGHEPSPVAADVVAVETAMLRAGRIGADDLRIGTARFEAGADVRDLPVAWVRRADGELSVELRDEPSDARGSAWCETGVGDIEDVVRQLVLNAATTQREVRVRDVRLTVTQVAPDVLVADGECRLSWTVLRLRLGARVTVGVAGSSIVVQALDVHSGNPLAALVLRLLRRQIASAVGARLDLQDGVPSSLTVSGVRLGVQDRRIRAEVVFGGAGG